MDNSGKNTKVLMCICTLILIIFILILINEIWFSKKDKSEGKYIHTDGTSFPLIDGSKIYIVFKEGYLHANIGCNTISGLYEIKDGILNVGPLSMTKKSCTPEIDEQDYKLLNFLGDKPAALVQDSFLVLTNRDGIKINLVEL